jgi:hypothetical protein
MVVKHVSFLFSEMTGVKEKLLQFREACSYEFPSCNVETFDWSLNLKFWRIFKGLNRGFFLPWLKTDILILRHNFFDPSIILCFLIRKLIGHQNYLEHHSDHIAELHLRGFWGSVLGRFETLCCFAFGGLVDRHICVSESIMSIQKQYFMRGRFEVVENGYSRPVGFQGAISSKPRKRQDKITLVFVAAKFSPWHGLDKLNALADIDPSFIENFSVILVGDTTNLTVNPHFVIKGVMSPNDTNRIVQTAEMCVDSLNLSILDLNDSSSLKSRLYVAFGKPILGEFVAVEGYEDFTYALKVEVGFGQKLFDWYSRLDQFELKAASEKLYQNRISWRAVVRKLKNITEE